MPPEVAGARTALRARPHGRRPPRTAASARRSSPCRVPSQSSSIADGQDHRDRVGQALAGDVRRGAVRGLRHAPVVRGVDRRRDAQRAGQLTGHVGEDVAEHVLGDDDVEGSPPGAAGAPSSRRCGSRPPRRRDSASATSRHTSLEQPRAQLQHVGLVHDRHLACRRRRASSKAVRAIRSTAGRVKTPMAIATSAVGMNSPGARVACSGRRRSPRCSPGRSPGRCRGRSPSRPRRRAPAGCSRTGRSACGWRRWG